MLSLANPHSGSSLALFGVKSRILSASARADAELGCTWLRGVSSPGFMAAGLLSCVLAFGECFGIVLLPARKWSYKPQQLVGVLASCCHLLLFFWSKPNIMAGKCPLCPSNGLWHLFHSLSGWEQCNVEKNQLILPAAGPCLPCSGWYPGLCLLVPGGLSLVLKAAARS